MKKDINIKIFVIVIIGILIMLFCSLVYSRFVYSKNQSGKNDATNTEKIINIDWKEKYPYDITVEEVSVGKKEEKQESKYRRVLDKIQHKSALGEEWVSSLPIYDSVCKFGYALRAHLTDPSNVGSYLKLKNGYWIKKSSDTIAEISRIEAENKMAPYISLNNYLKENKVPFYYIFTPNKECDIDNQYPDGATYYINTNTRKYMKVLKDYGVEYIDLHKEMHADGLDHYSHFFVTDHHWTADTGLWAASEIADNMSQKLGIDMKDAYSFGDYENITFPDSEFGSMGMGVTHCIAESEDLVVPFPKFNTEYRVEVPNKGVDITGTFDDVFVDEKQIQDITNEGGGAAYGKVAYGNPPYLKITNLKNTTGPKVLMIRDSFSIVVAPYLAASCSELILLDVRPENGNFNGSVVNVINQFEPDIVLTLLSYPYDLSVNEKS